MYSKISFSGAEPFVSNLDYSKSVQPVITAGFDLAVSRNLHRLFSRVELGWFRLKYSGISPASSRDTFRYDINMSNLSASVSSLYNLINLPLRKLYVGGAFALNNTLSSDNSLTKDTDLPLRPAMNHLILVSQRAG